MAPATPVESSLVAVGRVVDASALPVDRAVVHIQALSSGKPGGEFGCTGAYLVGDWLAITTADGRFTFDLRLTTPRTPVCVVVLGMPPGDTAWRDTAAVVTSFRPIGAAAAPDTVRFELRMAR